MAGRSRRAAIIGVVVSDTARLMMIASAITSANSKKNEPMMPPMNNSGTKTATRLTDIDTTVNPTSRAPTSAARCGAIPSSTWRAMFSSTTIASSTTKPVATTSAISDRLLRLSPSSHIAASVPASDATIATAGTSVARHERRKAATTSTTSAIEASRLTSTSCNEARIVRVRSEATSSLMSAGSAACNAGICARIASTTWMMFAPGARVMMPTTAGLPL